MLCLVLSGRKYFEEGRFILENKVENVAMNAEQSNNFTLLSTVYGLIRPQPCYTKMVVNA